MDRDTQGRDVAALIAELEHRLRRHGQQLPERRATQPSRTSPSASPLPGNGTDRSD